MIKYADIITQLQPHQQAAMDRALAGNLILAHSTGSGKTLTAIAAADKLGKPTTVITPASLVENFKKELAKHKKGGPPFSIYSLTTAAGRGIPIPKGNTVIIDEAHMLRNEGTLRSQYLRDQLPNAGRIIALTGTPAYNNITDWAPLANLVAQKDVVPETPEKFREKFIYNKPVYPGFWARLFYGAKTGYVEELRNKGLLRKSLHPYVDVFNANVEKPAVTEQTIPVEMSPDQRLVYKYVEGAMPASLLFKLEHDLPPNKAEAVSLNSFLTGVRQVSNTPQQFVAEDTQPGPKITKAVAELKKGLASNPRFRALVYSNYLGSGIYPIAGELDKAKIPYATFTGDMTPAQKKEVVDKYNAGKVPIILGSGSASEGLDLRGTRLIQLLEPHFNNARLSQVIGRGVRYKSHADLPPEERKVLVQRFLSKFPPGRTWWGGTKAPPTSVDEYLTSRSAEKDRLIQQIREALE